MNSQSPTSEEKSIDDNQSIASRQIRLKSLIKPSRFNIVRCNTTEDSSSSPEEKPNHRKNIVFKNLNEENKEEF